MCWSQKVYSGGIFNRPFILKKSKSNLILMISNENHYIRGLKEEKFTQMNKKAYIFYDIFEYWRHFLLNSLEFGAYDSSPKIYKYISTEIYNFGRCKS